MTKKPEAVWSAFGYEGFTIWDLRFTIWDLRLGIWDLGFGIWDPTARASLQLVRKKRQNSLNVYPSLFFVLCSLL